MTDGSHLTIVYVLILTIHYKIRTQTSKRNFIVEICTIIYTSASTVPSGNIHQYLNKTVPWMRCLAQLRPNLHIIGLWRTHLHLQLLQSGRRPACRMRARWRRSSRSRIWSSLSHKILCLFVDHPRPSTIVEILVNHVSAPLLTYPITIKWC